MAAVDRAGDGLGVRSLHGSGPHTRREMRCRGVLVFWTNRPAWLEESKEEEEILPTTPRPSRKAEMEFTPPRLNKWRPRRWRRRWRRD